MLKLEFARRNQNLTQGDVSGRTRIHVNFISLIENGRGIPTAEQAARLSRTLGVPTDELLLPVVDAVVAQRG